MNNSVSSTNDNNMGLNKVNQNQNDINFLKEEFRNKIIIINILL